MTVKLNILLEFILHGETISPRIIKEIPIIFQRIFSNIPQERKKIEKIPSDLDCRTKDESQNLSRIITHSPDLSREGHGSSSARKIYSGQGDTRDPDFVPYSSTQSDSEHRSLVINRR